MMQSMESPTPRRMQDLGEIRTLEVKGINEETHTFVGRYYTQTGPKAGVRCLAWTLAGEKYEAIDVPPQTDILVSLSDGDYARIRLENPEVIDGRTNAERRASDDKLRWSLTNVGMQVAKQGIEMPRDAVFSTQLRIGKPLTITSAQWPTGIKSNGDIETIFVYDRTKPVTGQVAIDKPKASILEDFRRAVKQRIATQAIRDTSRNTRL